MTSTADTPGSLDHVIELLGEPPWRSRADREADAAAWDRLEEHLGTALPADFKRFADLYAPCVLHGHLVIHHPRRGGEPLLSDFIAGASEVVDMARTHLEVFPPPPSTGLPDLIAWGYDNWDGDLCFFQPDSTDPSTWPLAVIYRHIRHYFVYDGSFSAFLQGLLTDTLARTDRPTGWPATEPLWRPIEPWR